ncbi:MAG: SDR family NAD(P)-dependent oxidoreductase [Alphaproteobacteria bacterium]|nr:SDR family NAD(P)-dependent oxidoreductase [Alphaproteobacteria bacterium]
MPNRNTESVLITGASSGIGAALAEAYATPGARLALTGRDAERLKGIAALCTKAGAAVSTQVIDVADRAAMAAFVAALDAERPLDLVIANAGIGGSTSGLVGGDRSEAVTRRIFAVNLDGVLNTVLPAVPLMSARRRGQIAIVSSLAAYIPLPGMAAYGATKSAIKSYGEALRMELRPKGIGVSVICPGYVRSRLTANGPKVQPFVKEASAAAELIKRRLARNPAVIAFPWPLVAATWAVGALPSWLKLHLLSIGLRDD